MTEPTRPSTPQVSKSEISASPDTPVPALGAFQVLARHAFSSDLKRMSVVVRRKDASSGHLLQQWLGAGAEVPVVVSKGAPEVIR